MRWILKSMMNRFEGRGSREAKIRYLDGDFQILMPGSGLVPKPLS